MLGAVIAQLFRLDNANSSQRKISLYNIGIPLASLLQGIALITVLIGGHRYWLQQNAMARGQAHGASWDIWLIFGLVGLVSPFYFLGPHKPPHTAITS